MKRVASIDEGCRRVTRVPAALVLIALLSGVGALAQDAPKFTVNTEMARGPVDAAVTIVEFSDYQ